jgi:predicted nucleic acid-binding protein
VVVEFLLGHPRDPVRADRVLDVVEQVEATPRITRRAARLLGRVAESAGRAPSVTDGMIAAFGEIYGAVATNDPVDLRALADVGDGFEVYVVPDLVKTLDRGR